jgi:hypothetical protein
MGMPYGGATYHHERCELEEGGVEQLHLEASRVVAHATGVRVGAAHPLLGVERVRGHA